MAIVAQYVARLTLSKSLSQHRWLCTVAEAVSEAAAGDVNLVQSKGDKLFHQLRSMEVREGSSELSEMIDKWVADGVFLKRHHVVSWIVQLRRFHKFVGN